MPLLRCGIFNFLKPDVESSDNRALFSNQEYPLTVMVDREYNPAGRYFQTDIILVAPIVIIKSSGNFVHG